MDWRAVADKLLEQERQENTKRDEEKQRELAGIQARRETILRICAELEIVDKLAEIGGVFWGTCTINTDFPVNPYPRFSIMARSPVYYCYVPGNSQWGRDGLASWPSKVVGSTDTIMVEICIHPHTSEESMSVTVYGASGKSKPGHGFYITNFSVITEDDKKRLDECLSKVCLEASKFVTKVNECRHVIIDKVLQGEFFRGSLPAEFELPPEVLTILLEQEEQEKKKRGQAELLLSDLTERHGCLSCLFGFLGL